jgi:hypothetical protein
VYLDAWVAAESAKAVGRAGKRIAARTGRWRRLCAPRRCNDIPPASSTSRRRALGKLDALGNGRLLRVGEWPDLAVFLAGVFFRVRSTADGMDDQARLVAIFRG